MIRTFDRARREIECEYLRADGTREPHLEGSLVFSRCEEHFDRYNRCVEKRYYGADNGLFQSVTRIYDPAGKEIDTSEIQYQSAQNRTTRKKALTDGTQVEICITDAEGKALVDDSGRCRWIERHDTSGHRVKIEYFDPNGNPTLFQGHYGAEYEYDSLGCLNMAAYSYPLDQDSVLNKKFRFGPKGSAHVQFESLNRAGDKDRHDAYLVEYAMRRGDQFYYVNKVTSSGNQPLEFRTRQVCQEVRLDGSYVVSVFVVSPGAELESQGVCDMTMTRSGKLVESSLKLDFSMVPMPAYPVFIGDTWQMEILMKLSNPFTGDIESVTLHYSYLLRNVFVTNDGYRLAQIEVQCPKTRVPLGLAAAYTISASGITLFEVDRGFLFASTVHSETLTSVGADEYLTQVSATVQYYDPKQQSSTTENGTK